MGGKRCHMPAANGKDFKALAVRAASSYGSVVAAFLVAGKDQIWRQRVRYGRRRNDVGPDLAPTSADKALIGRGQRHVGIDPEPALAREHLHIEVQMAARAVGVVQVI